MLISYTFPPSVGLPLLCDCQGAVVYLQLLPAHYALARDRHGVLRAFLANRTQLSDGSWTSTFDVDEAGLVSPTPSIGGGMIQSVCCQGCTGFAAEAYNQSEFGGRIAIGALVVGPLFVRHMARAFLLSDWRAWIGVPSTAEDVDLHLKIDGARVTTFPLKIPAGHLASQAGSAVFVSGSTYRIPEDALVEVEVLATGSATNGLECWFFGHLNPSTYMSPPT